MENEENSLDKVKVEFSKTCEICFDLIHDISDCEVPDELFKDIIEILFIEWDITIDKETVFCTDCGKHLRQAFDFKTLCIETEDMLVPFIDSDGKEVDLFNVFNISPPTEEMENRKCCRLCRNSFAGTDDCCLFKYLDNPKRTKVFEKHIPEVNLKVVTDSYICNGCQKVVEDFSNYLQNINKIKEGVSLSDHRLPNTSTFPIVNKETPSYKRVSINGTTVYIKVEPGEIAEESSKIEVNPRRRRRRERKMYKCDECGFETKNIQSHRKLHKSLSEVTNYKCAECSFVTKYLNGLRRHGRIHKRLDEKLPTRTMIHSCEFCSFKTLDWKAINKHVGTHTDQKPKNLFRYKCLVCNYATNKHFFFILHSRKHQPVDIEKKRKCPLCNYWTRFKNHIKRHLKIYHNVEDFGKIDISKDETIDSLLLNI